MVQKRYIFAQEYPQFPAHLPIRFIPVKNKIILAAYSLVVGQNLNKNWPKHWPVQCLDILVQTHPLIWGDKSKLLGQIEEAKAQQFIVAGANRKKEGLLYRFWTRL